MVFVWRVIMDLLMQHNFEKCKYDQQKMENKKNKPNNTTYY